MVLCLKRTKKLIHISQQLYRS